MQERLNSQGPGAPVKQRVAAEIPSSFSHRWYAELEDARPGCSNNAHPRPTQGLVSLSGVLHESATSRISGSQHGWTC
jgi:hypothetical protein